MKMHKFILLATLVASTTFASAQEYAFKVLANKGDNQIKAGAEWQHLKTGAVLNSGDEVKLGDNAYLGLVHSSGKPLEVKQAGVHKVSVLESQVPAGSSVLNKYTDFILSSNSAEAKKNRLSATGAVTREVAAGAVAIDLFLPEDNDQAGVFNDVAIVSWDDSNVKGPYVITVRNMFEDVLEKAETPETSYKIDLSVQKYAQENAILIEVNAKNDPTLVSKRHMIKRLPPAERERISTALQQIKSEVTEETALNKLLMAGFYENNNLLIDAIYAFQQVIELEPEAYKETYDDFLLRNKLK
jgi:hypothetical protein